MAYTVLQLITRAYYESGLDSRDFQTNGGDNYDDGLFLLNQVLSLKRMDNGALPYYKKYEFPLFAGVETYFIENLTKVDSMVFFLDSVRYSMTYLERREFWATSRAEDVRALPVYYTADRYLNGLNISVYFTPDQTYQAQIWGLFSLSNATLNQDLSLIYDDYYIEYLRYLLVQRLCSFQNAPMPDEAKRLLLEYDRIIRKRSSVLDMTCATVSSIGCSSSLNFGQVNIGKGFQPVSRF